MSLEKIVKMESQENHYEDEFVFIKIIDGIVCCETKKEMIINFDFAELALDKRIKICGNQYYPLLNDVRKVKYITKDAMQLLNSDKGTCYLTAGAFIIKSRAQEIFGNFFIKFKSHKVPAKLFTDKTKALQWLQQYKVH
ncbi:MAG: hypothetical protein NVV82_09635 [Sporocytophaga sp.]|nr:hypothetical protein [Sporocytophaga sp.]